MRRRTFQGQTVSYAAVGGTAASDLMKHPPEGTIPAEGSWRIGSGEDRFASAREALLSWTAQKAANLTIEEVRYPAEPSYAGVSFDAEGKPVSPTTEELEQRFDADGVPYVTGGMTVRFRGRVGAMTGGGEFRVITVIDEPRRVGFTMGTMSGAVVSGEESFTIEWREDSDEVWFTVRAFDTGIAMPYRLMPPLVRLRRKLLFERYLRAISPIYKTPA
jgi:uncharacterized protein (UPF0548 family)